MSIYKKWRPSRKDRHEVKKEYLIKVAEGKPVFCMGCGMIFHPPSYEGMFLHHLLPVEKFPERFWDMDNLKPLCKKCHNKVHWSLYAYRKSAGK